MEIQKYHGRTNGGLTWVGARDTCVSKKLAKQKYLHQQEGGRGGGGLRPHSRYVLFFIALPRINPCLKQALQERERVQIKSNYATKITKTGQK